MPRSQYRSDAHRRQCEAARIPPRGFIATVTTAIGGKITTTIYGPTAYAAEQTALQTIPHATRIEIHSEAGIR